MGSIHQHFTHRFYENRSQKCKKTFTLFFCTFMICARRARARKMLVQLTPGQPKCHVTFQNLFFLVKLRITSHHGGGTGQNYQMSHGGGRMSKISLKSFTYYLNDPILKCFSTFFNSRNLLKISYHLAEPKRSI